MHTHSMNKVKRQPSAHTCPSAKGAAICTLKGLFSMWEARERKKFQKPATNAVKRASCLLFQQAEVVHMEWLWQRELLALQPFTINSPSSVLQGAKYEYSFPPLHPRQPPPDSCSELPPHTLVTS